MALALDAADCACAVAASPFRELSSATPVAASRDAALAPAMPDWGIAIPEAGVVQSLLQDLQR
jgi:hypothetical protein